MTIRVGLTHQTTYRFDKPVGLSPHEIRLRPAPHCRTPIKSYSLKVLPAKHFLNWQQDPFGNWVARLVFPDKAAELSVTVDLVAEMTVINPFDFFVEKYAEKFPFEYPDALRTELLPFLEKEAPGPLLDAWLKAFRHELRGGMAIVDMLVAANSRVLRDVSYIVRMEPGIQTCEQTLGLRKGSCRDSAWLLVQVFRHLGLAARFASGYLIQLAADVRRWTGRAGRSAISPTCMHGPRSTSRAQGGSGWTRPPACSREKGTSRSPAPRSPPARHRSPASRTWRKWNSGSTWKCAGCTRIRASHGRIRRRNGKISTVWDAAWTASCRPGTCA
jgi:transglutaminase-like putative cysteine protease